MTERGIKLTALALIVSLVLIAVIFFAGTDNDDFAVSVDLYFYNEDLTGVVTESCEITYNKTEEIIPKIIKEINKGSRQADKKKIVKEIKLEKITHNDDGSIVIDVKKGFLSGNSAEDVLAAYTVIKSVCDVERLTGISRVKLTVEGENITTTDGKVLEYFSYDDIKLSDTDGTAQKRIALYFKIADKNELAAELRTVEIADGKNIEKIIIEELLKGPKSDKLTQCINGKVLSVDVTERICFVNFEASFVEKNSGDNADLAVQSVVKSLSGLEDVDGVQILVDGKKVQRLGSIDVSGVLKQ